MENLRSISVEIWVCVFTSLVAWGACFCYFIVATRKAERRLKKDRQELLEKMEKEKIAMAELRKKIKAADK